MLVSGPGSKFPNEDDSPSQGVAWTLGSGPSRIWTRRSYQTSRNFSRGAIALVSELDQVKTDGLLCQYVVTGAGSVFAAGGVRGVSIDSQTVVTGRSCVLLVKSQRVVTPGRSCLLLAKLSKGDLNPGPLVCSLDLYHSTILPWGGGSVKVELTYQPVSPPQEKLGMELSAVEGEHLL
jgi:hypothetical protein